MAVGESRRLKDWLVSVSSSGLHLPSLCAGAMVDIGGGMGCGNCPYTAG